MSVATIVARRARRVFRLWGAAGPSRQLTTRRARCEGHSRRVRRPDRRPASLRGCAVRTHAAPRSSVPCVRTLRAPRAPQLRSLLPCARVHTPRARARTALLRSAAGARCAPAHRAAPRCSMACVRTRVRTASTMRAQGGAHGRREGTCCCSCLLRPSCSWTPDLRLHLPPAGCSCVDYPEPSPEIRSRKWVK